MGVIVIALEGVLRSDTGQPIREGMMLYRAFEDSRRIFLLLDDMEPALAKQFMQVEGMLQFAELVEADERFTGTELRSYQLERIRAREQVDFLIDSSPANIANALGLGVVGLLFSQPRYLRSEFRPDLRADVRPWAEISEEITRQALLKHKDTRLSDPEVVNED